MNSSDWPLNGWPNLGIPQNLPQLQPNIPQIPQGVLQSAPQGVPHIPQSAPHVPQLGPSSSWMDARMSGVQQVAEPRDHNAHGLMETLQQAPDGEIPCDDISTVVAINDAYLDTIKDMIRQVEKALEGNREKQRDVITRQRIMKEDMTAAKRKVPVQVYLPPYFKDEHGMCPPLSDEAKRKLEETTYDPLEKEERRWTPSDVRKLRDAVHLSLLDAKLQPLKDRRELLKDKLASCDVTTTDRERKSIRAEFDSINRKIEWEKGHYQEIGEEGEDLDYSQVDWALISTSVFKGLRSPTSLRLRWMNELSPRWSQEGWKKNELAKLKELRENNNFISWNVLANQLGTKRSPWQCFEKYRSEFWNVSKPWTQEEDEKLTSLVNMLQVNGKIQWDKVTYFMPGRNRQQVRTRYLRTLDENIRHGRWTKEEDLVLLSAVRNFGAKEWSRVSKQVPGRTQGQCRDRWINVLSRNIEKRFWTCCDDEILLFGVTVFGRGAWAKISTILEDKDARICRRRYQQLVGVKLKLIATCASADVRQKLFGTAEKKHEDIMKVLCDELNGQQTAAVNRTVQTYKDFGRLTKKTEDPKEFRDSVVKFTEEHSNPVLLSKSRTERLKWESQLNKNQLYAEIEKIRKKHAENEVRREEILDLVQPTDDDRTFFVKSQKKLLAAKGMRVSVPPAKRNISSLVARMSRSKVDDAIDENMESWANSVFDLSLPEEERSMYVTEALCEETRVLDQLEWQKSLSESLAKDAKQIINYVIGSTLQKASKVVEAQRNGEAIPADCTLPPNTHTMMMSSTFESLRPQLNRLAVSYFDEVKEHENGTAKKRREEGNIAGKGTYSARDRMLINLPDDITQSNEYMLYKAYLRCLLLEPMKINQSLESNEMIADRKAKVDARRKIKITTRKRKYGTNQDATVENSNDEEEEEEELLAAIEAEMGIDDRGEGTEQQEPPNKKRRSGRPTRQEKNRQMIEEMNGKEAEEAAKEGNQENSRTAANPDDLNESGEIDFRDIGLDMDLYEEDEREEMERQKHIEETVLAVIERGKRESALGMSGISLAEVTEQPENKKQSGPEPIQPQTQTDPGQSMNFVNLDSDEDESQNTDHPFTNSPFHTGATRSADFDPNVPGPSYK